MKELFKKTKDYNTHKLYEISEFIFDNDIKQNLENYMKRYRHDFEAQYDEKSITSDTCMMLVMTPLLEELKFYYNNDICFTVATCNSIAELKKYNLRTNAYYFENSLFRIACAWEYIFIVLNEFLHTGLIVGRDLKEWMVEAACHKIDFVKYGKGYRVVTTRLPDDTIEEIKPTLKKKIKLFNISQLKGSNSFQKSYKKQFSRNIRMQQIFDTYKSEEVKKVIELRNEVVHRRPLGAKFSVAPLDFLPAQGIDCKPNGWFDSSNLPILLEKNIYALRFAIQTLVDIVFNNDVPNSKVNQDMTFFAYRVDCLECGKKLLINEYTVDYFNNKKLALLCPFCGKTNVKVDDKMEVHDRFLIANLREYNEALIKHWNSEIEEINTSEPNYEVEENEV